MCLDQVFRYALVSHSASLLFLPGGSHAVTELPRSLFPIQVRPQLAH
ncbi:hypothetical protein ARZXY2_865 [Arthrobacter sp. ZXY-2]|nr:hypothetical protein ARZXY2_865 [Arthrobacter sp. ZXY-2]